jgi:Na+-driven multidrug efflux pump
VANLLGARQPYLAKSVAWLAVYIATVISGVLAVAVYYGHRIFGLVFSADQDVLRRMHQIAPLVAGFQVIYGLQGAVQGALRGGGKQLSLSGLVFLCSRCFKSYTILNYAFI